MIQSLMELAIQQRVIVIGIALIYRYILHSSDHDLIRQKEIEDWILEKQLKTVPGVEAYLGSGA